MNALVERKWTTLLFNPFLFIAGAEALMLGLAAMLAAGVLCRLSNTHLDGVLDLHEGLTGPWYGCVLEGLADWASLALVLLGLGMVISKTSFRAIDVFGTQALARWPSILLVALTLPPAFRNYSRELLASATQHPLQLPPFTIDAAYFFAATLGMLPLTVWMAVLMYRAYAVSCNVRGARAVLSFIAALVVAEIISKLVIYHLR